MRQQWYGKIVKILLFITLVFLLAIHIKCANTNLIELNISIKYGEKKYNNEHKKGKEEA